MIWILFILHLRMYVMYLVSVDYHFILSPRYSRLYHLHFNHSALRCLHISTKTQNMETRKQII